MQQIDKSENQETTTAGMQSVQMPEKQKNISHEKTLRAMTDAVSYMNRLIAADVEYPDAHWRASQVYTQFSAEELQAAYDTQDEWF